MKLRLYQDSRDLDSYKRFGSADLSVFNMITDYDDPSIPEHVQPVGDFECGAFSCEYLASNKTKKEYDIQELFDRTPHNALGVIPNDIFKEVINRGLKILGTDIYEKPFKSFWRADTDPSFDKFDSTRSGMIQVESPAILFTNWYEEWLNLAPDSIMPMPKKAVSGHMYITSGWVPGFVTPVYINGVLVFKIEWWGGQKNYMTREVYNYVISQWGCGAVVFSDVEQDEKRQKTILEKIKDACVNVILLLKQLLIIKQSNSSMQPNINQTPENVEIQQPNINPKYLWDTPENAKHSVRLICDEEGLTVEQKNTMCATIGGESGWKTNIIHPNYVVKNGQQILASTDNGICQWNDYYHGDEISPNEAVNNPEKAVRLMCKYWKMGETYRNWWIAYRSGSYKRYL